MSYRTLESLILEKLPQTCIRYFYYRGKTQIWPLMWWQAALRDGLLKSGNLMSIISSYVSLDRCAGDINVLVKSLLDANLPLIMPILSQTNPGCIYIYIQEDCTYIII